MTDETPGAARVLKPLYRQRLFALIDVAPTLMRLPGLGVKLGIPLWAE